MDKLWELDIDDGIWQNLGLSEADDLEQPPAWMSDESTRKGIRALLDRDRSDEELMRLQHERDSMQVWFREEWEAHKHCLETTCA